MTGNQRTILFAVIIAVCALLNLCVPPLFYRSYSDEAMYVAFLLAGGLVSQVCLLATWAALGAQPAPLRIPLSLGALVLGTFAYLAGLQWMDSGMPLDVAIVIGGAALLGFLAMQCPLWLVRLRTRMRIDRFDAQPLTADQEKGQFGLRHVLLWTTLISVALVVGKAAMPTGSLAANTPWFEIAFVLLVCGTFVTLLGIPCIWIVLSDRKRGPWLGLLLAVLLLGPLLVVTFILAVVGGGASNEFGRIVGIVFCLGLGSVGGTLAILSIFRGLGYRLLGIEDAAGDQEPVRQ